MHRFLATSILGFAVSGIAACAAQTGGDEAAFVTRLGVDTVAVERFTRMPDRIRAEVMLRVPETTLRVYELRFAGDDGRAQLTTERYDPETGFEGEPIDREERVLAEGAGIPFIDMVHWPFELMLRRAVGSAADADTFALATRRRPLRFVVARVGPGRYTATHPTRGTMDVQVDDDGRMLSLDASKTTRALMVTRQATIDVAALAAHFAASGRPMGELSGRGTVEADVAGAEISVDYGRPRKRGREIFGALVPWEKVWRTGANRATHFTTSRDLRVGDATIPAGSYTLFTIPRPDVWTLIVNRRTDINGQAYDSAQDRVRLEMRTRALEETVEPFTIAVEETDGGGELRLRWDRTEAYLPFRVVR